MDTKETNLSDKQEENIVKTDLTNGEINAIELLSNKDSLKGNLEAALKHKRTLKRGSMEKANVNRAEFRITKGKKDGVICVFGLGQRFPVSLRKEQYKILFDNQEAILAFVG